MIHQNLYISKFWKLMPCCTIPTSVVQQPVTATPLVQQPVKHTSFVQQPITATPFIQHPGGSTSFITQMVPSTQNTTGIEGCSQDIYSDGLADELTDDELEVLLTESTDNYSSTPTLLSSVSPSILPLPSVQHFSSSSTVPASVQLPVPPSTTPVS